ncbi:regulator of RNase E activity RraA [Actinoplanes tereljensis]|uniref:Putative 4-hydroxy-4-methyl-2-oxoglutarate aldolase n=1 Tax=Paractinoplanes tereljensis TaxID=571912 RepID=A0A919TTP7_9ACTN|nr:RraA family protein [Actinoplanes tereljensis]GIF20227.1 4-carboxy-4-hydroxy-2-oxoadipate aldolase [Actinoplanes tereljensis]
MADLSPTTLAEIVGAQQVMDIGIRPLWTPIPRIAGPAFTVRCPPSDHLMLHAAIYQAPPGSIVVVESGDLAHALAGGNVCAVAQRNGIAGFVLDGVIRDIAEVRSMGFPVFGRGVIPVPAGKAAALPLNVNIRCGGVPVQAGDLVVADEEGIVVVPAAQRDEVLTLGAAKQAKEESQTLDEWEQAHRARITALLEG